MASRLQSLIYHSDLNDGTPNSGGYLEFYEPGLATPKAAYGDEDEIESFYTTTLNARGEANIFIKGNYKIKVYDKDGNLIDTQDNVYEKAATPCLPDDYRTGLIGSQAADINHDITISTGAARDTTGAYDLRLISAMTKQIDAAWAVSNAAGGLDAGTVANNTEYWYFLIRKDSDSSVDVLISASYSSPTMPSGYTYRSKPIHWVLTDGSANILAHKATETAGGGIDYAWYRPILDINLTNTLTTTARTDALSVPTGIKVKASINVHAYDATSTALIYISDPDTLNLGPSTSIAPLLNFLSITAKDATGQLTVHTNTSRQIRSRASIATVDAYHVATLGFEWSRK